MARFKNLLKRKRFKNWDEAFHSLTPQMRQHSVRVAEYTQVLFEGVCKSSYYTRNRQTPVYMNETYADIAYKCGFYHQIGKALDPDKYPDWRGDFTEEEKRAYCAYTVEGRVLVEELQEEFGDDISMPSQMVQDACEQHMERWDGSGYPYGSVEDEISLIAQIVGMAKELDRLLCERKSETPYEEAVDTLLAEDNQDFSPNLKDVFQACQPELKNVFKKYIQYTRIMPKTVPLVEKREGRPFGLNYRQIVAGRGIGNMMFQAVPWFAGVLNKPEARESIEEVEELLLRTGMVGDMTTYFLYEAADLIARMQNCDLQTGGVLLPVFNSFYTGENQTDRLKKMLEDTGIDKKKLILVVPETLVRGERSIYDRLSEYIGLGIVLMLDDYHPEDLPLNLVREIGFTHVRLAEDADAGIIPKERIQEWRSHGITLVNQPAGNAYLTEEELIKYLLLHE